MEYFFIGDAELVTAFCFIGVRGVAAGTPVEVRSAFARMTRSRLSGAGATELAGLAFAGAGEACSVLILTEEVAEALGDELTEWQMSGEYPLVVEIPGLLGRDPARKSLVDAIREAVGVHV